MVINYSSCRWALDPKPRKLRIILLVGTTRRGQQSGLIPFPTDCLFLEKFQFLALWKMMETQKNNRTRWSVKYIIGVVVVFTLVILGFLFEIRRIKQVNTHGMP